MVESLKELNKICQKPRYKEAGNWMVRHILRDAALPVTWLLLHTPITANQVTVISLVVGLIGIACFAGQSVASFLIGVLLMQLWYYLDHVDGQIARYRKTVSLSGRFFDFLTHHIIHGVVFFSLGVYAFLKTDLIFFVIWGFVTSLMMLLFNLVHDTKYKTFFEKLEQNASLKWVRTSVDQGPSEPSLEPSFLRKGFSLLHKLCEIHVLMNILTACALIQMIWFPDFDMRLLILVLYGLCVPLLSVSKIFYVIKEKKIDDEFQRYFRET